MREYVIWLFVDGKPGHQNQSEGLVLALKSYIQVKVVRLPYLPFWKTLIGKLFHKNHVLNLVSKPDLVIGAGHATHASLFLARLLFGAKQIVLMKPSLPLFLFDLCLIPEHDGVIKSKRVIMTKGVLNRNKSAEQKKINEGMILIGGPSKHYAWDQDQLIKELGVIISEMPHINWTITDSRRTPDKTVEALKQLSSEQVSYISCTETENQWLPDKLAYSQYTWVTEDSVSMVYEALTAKNYVGLLSVPMIQDNRVSKGVRSLVDDGYLVRFDDWKDGQSIEPKVILKSEDERCAKEIVMKWYGESLREDKVI